MPALNGYDNTFVLNFLSLNCYAGAEVKKWARYKKGNKWGDNALHVFDCLRKVAEPKAYEDRTRFDHSRLDDLKQIKDKITRKSRLYIAAHCDGNETCYNFPSSEVAKKAEEDTIEYTLKNLPGYPIENIPGRDDLTFAKASYKQLGDYLARKMLDKPEFKTNFGLENLTLSLIMCEAGKKGTNFSDRLQRYLQETHGIWVNVKARRYRMSTSNDYKQKLCYIPLSQDEYDFAQILNVEQMQSDYPGFVSAKRSKTRVEYKMHQGRATKTLSFWQPNGKLNTVDAYAFKDCYLWKEDLICLLEDNCAPGAMLDGMIAYIEQQPAWIISQGIISAFDRLPLKLFSFRKTFKESLIRLFDEYRRSLKI